VYLSCSHFSACKVGLIKCNIISHKTTCSCMFRYKQLCRLCDVKKIAQRKTRTIKYRLGVPVAYHRVSILVSSAVFLKNIQNWQWKFVLYMEETCCLENVVLNYKTRRCHKPKDDKLKLSFFKIASKDKWPRLQIHVFFYKIYTGTFVSNPLAMYISYGYEHVKRKCLRLPFLTRRLLILINHWRLELI
jgi:hypothetical protein